MTFDDAVKQVQETLQTNRSGAYAVAVRLQATFGHNADKLMAEAVKGPQGSSKTTGFTFVALELPTAEQIEAELSIAAAEIHGDLSEEGVALVHAFAQIWVIQRDDMLRRLGFVK